MRIQFPRALKDGARQFVEHPQLWLTILTAVAICGSFLFVADKFLNIARDAQDELVNVRIGSLQDAFAPLASELSDQPDALRAYMRRMQELNPTIQTFDIVREAGGIWSVILSSKPEREGGQVYRQDLTLSLAAADPANSYTVEQSENGERFVLTARAIEGREGGVTGVVLTRQTLSAADQRIKESLTNAVLMLALILLFLLLLFFKHARIIDYTVLYRKLREVDTLKDEFISMASHELRAPLTAIRGYADILKGGGISAEDQKLSLERIDLSAKQLDNLIVDMLDVSRIEQGRMTVKPVRLETKPLLEEIAASWQMNAQNKGLTFTMHLAGSAAITADPDRLRQILVNLLSNAVKYTQHGEITLASDVIDGGLVISVKDTGAGMTEEERGKLFTKFYRAAGREIRDQPGTGLGLWITKQLVEIMGGAISVESIKGTGTRFIVRFPLAQEEKLTQ